MSVTRFASACLVACTLVGGLGSCAEQQEALVVIGAPLWEDSEMCFVNPNSNGFLSFGVLDLYCLTDGARCVGAAPSYFVPVVLENQATAQTANQNNSGIDNSELQLKEVDIVLSSEQAGDAIETMRRIDGALVDFTVPLASDSLPSGAPKGIVVEAISVPTATALRDAIIGQFGSVIEVTVIATLTFHAERTGNSVGKVGEVEARDFSLPIRVCEGCLLSCDPCMEGQCEVADISTLTWTGGVCGNAQDGPLSPTICGE